MGILSRFSEKTNLANPRHGKGYNLLLTDKAPCHDCYDVGS